MTHSRERNFFFAKDLSCGICIPRLDSVPGSADFPDAMFNLRLSLLGAILIQLCIPAGTAAENLVRVEFQNPIQREAVLREGLDVWTSDWESALLYVSDEELEWLAVAEIPYKRQDEILQKQIENAEKGSKEWLTFEQYVADMENWAANHSGHVNLFSIGQSHQGRELWMMRLSDNAATDEDEPEALLISLQHAREWLAGTTLHGIAQHLIENYGSDPGVTELLNAMEVYVLLVANPDGYVFSHTDDRFWRKNRRNNGGGSFGVDLNRNWPWEWKSEPNMNSQTWSGPAPLTEPENIALNDWMTAPQRRLAGLLNYHTFGTIAMHNWAYTAEFPSNVDVMEPLVQQYAADVETVNGLPMRWGRWSVSLGNTGAGATIDYAAADLGIPSLTLELRPGDSGDGGFAPDPSVIPLSLSENIPAAVNFLEWAGDVGGDHTAPVLSEVTISRLSDTEATVSWTTDEPSTRSVLYGTVIPFPNEAAPDRLFSRGHTVHVTGLVPDTEYSLQACSSNVAGLETCSSKQTFRTAAVPQDITPPQPPALLSLRRTSGGSLEVRWSSLGETGIAGFRLYESEDLADWNVLRDKSELTAEMTMTVLPAPLPNQVRYFRMTTIDDSLNANESGPSDAYAFMLANSETNTLVVDGYDQWNSNAVSQGRNHTFAAWHGQALAEADVPFDTAANQEINAAVTAAAYDNIVWVLGDESVATETFNGTEQIAIRDFLEKGGNVFLSGSQIGYDLWEEGTSVDRSFFTEILNAAFIGTNAATFEVLPSADSIFDPIPVDFDNGSRGIYRVTSPDSIEPINGSAILLQASDGSILGIQREGLFGTGSTTGKLVYMTFGFETVYPEQRRFELMGDIIDYFEREPADPNFIMVK